MGYQTQRVSILDYSRGVNNQDPPKTLELSECQIAQNFILEHPRRLRARHGTLRTTYTDLRLMPRLHAQANNIIGVCTDHATALTGLYRNGGRASDSAAQAFAHAQSDAVETPDGTLYIVSKEGPGVRYYATDYENMGLPQPTAANMGSAAATPATTGGYMAPGEYHYCFSFGYGADDRLGLGFFSKSTFTLSATTTLAAHTNKVTLSSLPTSFGSINQHIERVHIWRTLANSLSAGPYFYLGYATGSSYVDDKADFELQVYHDKFEEGLPPQGNLVEWHQDRLWIADLENGESQLAFSNYGELDFFEPFSRIGIPGSDERILAIQSYLDRLLVFTGRGVYALYGNETDNFVFRKIDSTPCAVGRSPAIVRDECWFIGPEGVHAVRGEQVRKVAGVYRGDVAGACGAAYVSRDDIEPAYVAWGDEPWMVDVETESLRTLSANQAADPDEWMNAMHDAQDLCFTQENDGELRYWTGGNGIAYTAGVDAVQIYELFANDTPEDEGRDDTNTSDVAEGFECHLRTAEFDGSRPENYMLMSLLEIRFDQPITPDGGTTAEVNVYGDGDYTTPILTHTIGSGDQHLKIQGEVKARAVAIDIRFTDSTNRMAVDEIIFHYKELPTRWE